MENRTSFDWALRIEKEKGSAMYLNSISLDLVGFDDGRGTTDSGTSYRLTAGSVILTWIRVSKYRKIISVCALFLRLNQMIVPVS